MKFCLIGLLLIISFFNSAQNQWTWMHGSNTATNTIPAFGTQGSPSSTTSPGSLFGAVTWTDNSGNLWLFGGYSLPYGYHNDLWKYTISTNQWTWVKGPGLANQFGVYGSMNTPSITNNPGGRYLAHSWTDNSGNFWMYGGAGYSASSSGYLNDLWRYNPTTNQWTWMKGSSGPNQVTSYGNITVPQGTTTPGGRYNSCTFKDASGNLWLYGGYGYAATTATVGYLNDLWSYNITTGNWTWMKGSNVLDQYGVYGSTTVATPSNSPGGRRTPVSWTDANGDFWMFGGYGYATSTFGLMNDLWKYTVSTGNWTWFRGSNAPNSFGWYGTMGTPASNNDPGSRYYSTGFNVDNQGNLWMFGGYGYSASSASRLNDLWKYTIATNQWTWMKGSSVPNQLGIYGTQTVASPTNNPGGRYLQASWQDSNGYLWVFGGNGYTSTDVGYIEDMWRFDLCNSPTLAVNVTNSQNLSICSGNTTTLSATSGTNGIKWYATPASTTALGTGTNFVTPALTAIGNTSIYTYYAESYSCVPSASRTAISVTVNPTPTLSVNSGTICNGGVFVMVPTGAATYTYSGGSQFVFPTVNSSYTVTGTSPQGCVSTQAAVSQVVVNPSPVISVNSGTLCTGSSFVMVPSGAATYTYSSGSATVSPITNTFYIVTGTSSLGCVSMAPAVSSILVFNSSPISVNSGSICPGNSFTINPSGALSYTYSGGSAVVSPTVTATYSVSGTNSVGCISTAISTVNVHNNPVITVNSGSICSGSSFTLNPTGAATYTYSSGSPVVSPSVNSTYFVVGTSSAGCVSSFAAIANVAVSSLPVISVPNGTICPGSSFTLIPSGAGSYTYQGGSAIVSPGITTIYTITGSSGAGCVAASPAQATVFVTPNPSITVNSGSICAGNSFTLNPVGGTSYTFSGGSSVVSPSITTAYSVTATNSSGCLSSVAVSTVTVYSRPIISVNSGSICAGNSFTISPSGAVSYTISGGSTIVSPLNSSTYTITGTNSAGCVSSSAAVSSVVVNTLPVISVGSGSVCSGNAFTLNPSGASSYTYSSGSAIVVPSVTSTYSVSGTSGAGCVSPAVGVATVTVVNRPIITANSGSICAGNSFTIVPSGASSYTYSGGSSVVSPTISTTYSVTGINSQGCISASPGLANVAVSTTVNISVNSGSICAGNTFTLVPSGASSYTFSGGSAFVNPMVSTNYTVTGTNTAGCISNPAIATVVVVSLPSLTLNSGSICSGNSFTINPSGAVSYTFAGGSSVVSPAITSAYTVTGTNSSGCVSMPVVSNVTVNALPIITVSSGSVCAGNSYSIIAYGASSYTYSGGSALVSPTTNSTYSIIGTSTAGCTSSASAISTVSVFASPTISINSGTICSGNTFTLLPSGALTYSYSGGSALVSPGTTTSYSVTGTNSLGCLASNAAIATVTVLSRPIITVNSGSICSGNSFTLNPSGASSYTYSSGSSVVSPLSGTSYSVSGTGTNGCSSASPAIASVSVNALPVISVAGGSICSGQSFVLSPSGATTYTYSGGSATVSPSTNTSYTIVGTSALGCVSNTGAVATVTVNALPTITAPNGTICLGTSFTINPTGAASYSYSGGSPVVNPTVSTTYSVNGTNSAGCVAALPAIVNVLVTNTLNISVGSGSICSGNSFTLSASGANTYTYSSGSAIVSPTVTTSYSVSGTNASGCLSVPALATVSVFAKPTITVNSGTICSGNSFTLNPSGAVSYTFSSGSSVISPTTSTVYSITGTGTNGCVSTTAVTATILVNPSPLISVNSGSICQGQTFSLSPSGASTYSYSGGSAIVSPTVNSSYTITGTSLQGCVSSTAAVANITVNTLPVISVNNGSICSGSSFTIIPSGANSFTYSGGSSVVTPTATTSYSIVGTNLSGCTSSSPAVCTITVMAQPIITVNSGSICSGNSFSIVPSGASTYSYSGGSAVVSPTLSSTYTVNGLGSNGCISAPAISSVQVASLPIISVSNATICIGNSHTLVPSGAVSYTYSGGSAIVSPTVTSSYSITGTSSLGCVSSAIGVVTITVVSPPTISVSGGTICPGSSFTFNPSGALSYSYSGGSAVVSPTTSSVFTVSGSDAFGCLSQAIQATVVVSPVLNISVNSGLVCLGNSFTLSPVGASSYTYSSGSAVVSPTVTTSYSITGSSAGCTSTAAAVAVVSVSPLPTVSVSGGTICEGLSFTLSPSGAASYSYSSGSSIVSPTTSSNYTVVGTDNSGCESLPAIVSVMVNPNPTVTVNSGSICSGNSFTLIPSGALTYTISGGSSVVSPTTNTTYSVNGTDGNGCNSALPAIANVTVNALPVINIMASPSLICVGETATLSASGAVSYSWAINGAAAASGTSGLVSSPAQTSTYNVTGLSLEGCEGTANFVLNVSDCTGLTEQHHLDGIRLYPNPNAGTFMIELNSNAKLMVTNELGQNILSQKLSEGINRVDLSAYAKGIYFVRINLGDGAKVFKVLVQ
ncbi:MAG: T9SS type A sorting domain-containing protein [Bacteroidia bacterium]|nr:T9SS type A sorting domain-containing protein [Bacteroidia bacterium]